MKRDYRYTNNDNVANTICSADSLEILNNYSSNFLVTKYLLKKIFGISNCFVDLAIENQHFSFGLGIRFVLNTGKEKIFVDFKDDTVSFRTEDGIYRFLIIQGEAQLIEMILMQQDKVIIERFLNHRVQLEMHFIKQGKVCFFDIPVDLDYTVNVEIFNIIKADAGLSDLKKFYIKFFYTKQTEYDKFHQVTSVSIWDNSYILGNDSFEKGIKLDEILLKDSVIASCQLSKKVGDVIVTLKNGVYTVTGYAAGNIHINEIFDELLIKERKLESY